MSLTLLNIFDKGDVLCEGCQEPIKEYTDELILDLDVLYHKKCWCSASAFAEKTVQTKRSGDESHD